MTAPFHGPKLKVGRARRHIEELEAAFASYRASRPFALAFGQDGDFDTYTVTAQPLPDELPLVIGDAIHNLRTALDLLACDLVQLRGKSRSAVYFPFCNKESDFDGIIYGVETECGDTKGRRGPRNQFRKAGRDAVEAVRNLRPWEGPLRALHDLDVKDKHQMILPTLAFLRGANFGMGFTPGTVQMSISISGVPSPESATAVEDQINSSVRLVFPQVINVGFVPSATGQIEGREVEVVPTLHELAHLVGEIIRRFEAHRPDG